MAINQVTANHDTTTNTCTERDNDEVFHTTSRTVSHLTDSRCVRVIRQSDRNTTNLLANQLSQGNFTLPRQVRRKLNTTIKEVAVRCTYTHALDLIRATSLINDAIQTIR